ncbi:MAG TPA: type II secretion system F family protein [Acidimicrobiales bacterium]|jgi:tight adherence protein C|nr:type II secretion system F family protein [Acidimicrobiales bacterium]HRA33925.1 type II secretion system F family protein [Acidimicrobiales bacterium]
MSRPIVLVALLAGVGTTLVLSELRWFSRRPLDERLLPYVPGGWKRPPRLGVLSVGTFREVVRPLATAVGDLVGQVFGVRDDLPTRLARIHSPLDAAALRVRQLGWAGGVFVAAAALVLLAGPPTVLGALAVVGAPLLAFLVIEQQVITASTRWQRRLFLELPVVSEQIGMLLSAGYSLGGALERISRRGSGACARDLQRVGRRIRQGLSEAEALEEWAELADVPALHRLVGVLSLNRDTGDLGRLIAEEARAVRREVHRQLITQIDRRAQQVWIPVTVATLVPGTLFLAVPFLQAMRLFGS